MGNIALARQAVDRAEPLDFDQPRSERQANIQIEASPAGFVVRVEFTGPIAGIPAAIERLKAAGILELVQVSRPAPAAKPKAETVEPLYKPDGTACCPVHKRALSEGQYGLYCSAKARPGDVSNAKGYCGLKFAE
jgi:hypothetical protein